MTEKVETAEGLDAATLALLDEIDDSMIETEKKIASGEIPQNHLTGWSSDNWQNKASGQAPDDMEL
jgi:hypothetical protein